MSLIQRYTKLFEEFSSHRDNWEISSKEPFIVSRVESDSQLPLSITLFGDDKTVHVCFNLYSNKQSVELARELLKAQGKKRIDVKDEDSGLDILIDNDGFATVLSTSDSSPEEVAERLDEYLEASESILIKLLRTAQDAISKSKETEGDSEPAAVETKAVDHLSADQVVAHFLDKNDYKYEHDEEKKRFVFGFSTRKYLNGKDKPSLRIVIEYSDKTLLRFVTPWLYQFDLDKTDYSLIASAIAWFQFEYKFLSMSLDPSDGELRISIDIPLGDGVVNPGQIERLVTFIHQFSEDTYEELFGLMLEDSQAAEAKLHSLLKARKEKVSNFQWFESIKDKLDELSEQQKKDIEGILNRESGEQQRGGI
ncbi:hypothetical protein ACVFI8_10870 [Agarivorans sp. MS3-6]|uniref:hypothetical protein n=1 Tax=Agarivorans sp. TSD2052 TaxID=2937286 RepID=UPI00200F25C2|nr:hypothetical protein [Agarivorans sp. TSD2052]UPW18676.1 hypothetical protein M0C34_21080 [Agarivorans sp. TSD2052]